MGALVTGGIAVIAPILQETVKSYPGPDHQARNLIAVMSSFMLGVGLLTAVSMRPVDKDGLQ